MSIIATMLGKAGGAAIKETLEGVGGFAKDIRTAIKGYEMRPEQIAEIEVILAKLDGTIAEGQASIIVQEAKGGWLQRNWRPMLMCLFGIIIANNYIVHPYIALFWPGKSVMMEIPEAMWGLLKIGVGGYIVGRSTEKAVQMWKGN